MTSHTCIFFTCKFMVGIPHALYIRVAQNWNALINHELNHFQRILEAVPLVAQMKHTYFTCVWSQEDACAHMCVAYTVLIMYLHPICSKCGWWLIFYWIFTNQCTLINFYSEPTLVLSQVLFEVISHKDWHIYLYSSSHSFLDWFLNC